MKLSTIKVDGNVVVGKGAVVKGDVKVANKIIGDGRYAPLPDKPMINNHVLESGNNTYEYLGIEPSIVDISEQDIDNIIYGG